MNIKGFKLIASDSLINESISYKRANSDSELIQFRQNICSSCINFNKICTIIGCNCAGLGKVEFKYSKCPINKW